MGEYSRETLTCAMLTQLRGRSSLAHALLSQGQCSVSKLQPQISSAEATALCHTPWETIAPDSVKKLYYRYAFDARTRKATRVNERWIHRAPTKPAPKGCSREMRAIFMHANDLAHPIQFLWNVWEPTGDIYFFLLQKYLIKIVNVF